MGKIVPLSRPADSATSTEWLYDRLTLGFGKDTVVKDVDNIPLGVDFRAHVEQVLRQCAVVCGRRRGDRPRVARRACRRWLMATR